MKKLLTMLAGTALLLTGCGASSSGSGTSGTDPDNITLPDLSAYGIDTSQFSLSDRPFTQTHASGYTCYQDCAAPMETYITFKNSGGAMLCYDRQGRFRKYVCETDLLNYASEPTGEHTAEEYRAIGEGILRTMIPDYDKFAPDDATLIDTQIESTYYACELYMNRVYSPNAKDAASVSLRPDGSINSFGITYCDAEDADPAQFDSQLAAFTDECKAKYADWGDSIRCTADPIRILRINGSLYGFTTVTTTASDDRSACDGVVFLAQ